MPRIGRIIVSSAACAVVAGAAMFGSLVAPAQAAETAMPDSFASSSSGDSCKKKVIIGNGNNRGDIFHSSATTGGVNHNHVGIYYTTKTIVEAPGSGKKSTSRTASTHRVCAKAYKMFVKTSQAKRSAAGRYAHDVLRNKEYDKDFAANKYNGDSKLNCSELVWRAYKTAAAIDLDDNGGPGVYPDDIKAHDLTEVYKTLA